MLTRTSYVLLLLAMLASAATAQDFAIEIGGNAGYTLSEGVEIPGEAYARVDPKSAFSWGFNLDAIERRRGFGIGFLFGREESTLEASGPNIGKTEISSMNVDNYHGVFTYSPRLINPDVVPYFFVGLGATRWGSIQVQGRTIDGTTKFSSTWGAGVKVYRGRAAGLRLGVRWTPTYVHTDGGTIWCDPYWGCYTAGQAHYSHQFEFLGGLVFQLPGR